jgi:hypothetical protein
VGLDRIEPPVRVRGSYPTKETVTVPDLSADDREREKLLAGFDSLREGLADWVGRAPSWPPFDDARRLFARVEPRLRLPEDELDLPLVVGFLGGSGTGKSTLFNALLGARVSRAGKEYRPMTRKAVIACHPGADLSFLSLGDDLVEIHRLSSPILEQMVLIDCPDPDTQDPDEGPGGRLHLDVLRAVLPRCDVMVHTVTSQKYKSHVVGRELLRHAPGRHLLFVQTHATVDDDNRDDLRKYLDSLGLRVPDLFRLDGQDALIRQERGESPDGEFPRFRELLERDLGLRAKRRIRRANLVGLHAWFLETVRSGIDERLPDVARLESTIAEQRSYLLARVRAHVSERARSNRRLWRARVLRQLTLSWGAGPLSGLLGLWAAGGALVRSLILLRARTPSQAIVAATMAGGMLVGEKVKAHQAATAWMAEADLGITEGDLARARGIVRGDMGPARIAADLASGNGAKTGEPTQAELVEMAQEVFRELETGINTEVELRVMRRAGPMIHFVFEIVFCLLPVFLIAHMARNFFYEHLWLKQPLLGFDFFFQAAFWCTLWGVGLGALILNRLNRGLDRRIESLVSSLSSDSMLQTLFADPADRCEAIRRHTQALHGIESELAHLRSEVGEVADLGLGAIKTPGT